MDNQCSCSKCLCKECKVLKAKKEVVKKDPQELQKEEEKRNLQRRKKPRPEKTSVTNLITSLMTLMISETLLEKLKVHKNKIFGIKLAKFNNSFKDY